MEEYYFSEWPDRPFVKVEPKTAKEYNEKQQKGLDRKRSIVNVCTPVLFIAAYLCIGKSIVAWIFEMIMDTLGMDYSPAWLALPGLELGVPLLIIAIVMLIIGMHYNYHSYDGYKTCINIIEKELGEVIDGEFDVYRSEKHDVDIIILKAKDSECIKKLLNTLSQKQDWPILKQEKDRIVERIHTFENNVFTYWRKNFDSSDTCGLKVEVRVNGNTNEIIYQSVIY